MKIAYVCADFGIPVRGDKGASVHVREMAAALVGRGHEVCVVTPNPHGDNAIGAPVRTIAPPHWPAWIDRLVKPTLGGHARGPVELRELVYNAHLYTHASSLFRSWRPDVVYERYSVLNLSGLALARRFAIPHVLEVNAPLRLERERTVGLVFGTVASLSLVRVERGMTVLERLGDINHLSSLSQVHVPADLVQVMGGRS